MKFRYLEEELNLFKQDLIQLYRQKSGYDFDLEVSITKENDSYTISIDGPDAALWRARGRKPGGKFPPVDILHDWVERKITSDLPRANQLTFLISRSIAQNGIASDSTLEESINELMNSYKQRFENALLQDWNEDDSMDVLDKLNTMIKSAF